MLFQLILPKGIRDGDVCRDVISSYLVRIMRSYKSFDHRALILYFNLSYNVTKMIILVYELKMNVSFCFLYKYPDDLF